MVRLGGQLLRGTLSKDLQLGEPVWYSWVLSGLRTVEKITTLCPAHPAITALGHLTKSPGAWACTGLGEGEVKESFPAHGGTKVAGQVNLL